MTDTRRLLCEQGVAASTSFRVPDWCNCCIFRLDAELGFVALPRPGYPLSYTAGIHAIHAACSSIASNDYHRW